MNQPQNQRSCLYPLQEIYSQYLMYHVTNGHAKDTIRFYRTHLPQFIEWMEGQEICSVELIRPQHIRTYLYEYTGQHSQTGAHLTYRAIKAMLRWAWDEYDIEIPNPINKVKCSPGPIEPIKGVDPNDVDKLFQAARLGKFPDRDCALLAVLLDTGVRKSSINAIRICDVDIMAGSIYIRHMKNKRPMVVYLGKSARKYMRRYFKTLSGLPDDHPLWITETKEALSIDGLREIIRRCASRAGCPDYSFHDYRRYFALQSWRNGADIYAVSKLLGQSGTEVTRRYLADTEYDRQLIHARVSPLDHS